MSGKKAMKTPTKKQSTWKGSTLAEATAFVRSLGKGDAMVDTVADLIVKLTLANSPTRQQVKRTVDRAQQIVVGNGKLVSLGSTVMVRGLPSSAATKNLKGVLYNDDGTLTGQTYTIKKPNPSNKKKGKKATRPAGLHGVVVGMSATIVKVLVWFHEDGAFPIQNAPNHSKLKGKNLPKFSTPHPDRGVLPHYTTFISKVFNLAPGQVFKEKKNLKGYLRRLLFEADTAHQATLVAEEEEEEDGVVGDTTDDDEASEDEEGPQVAAVEEGEAAAADDDEEDDDTEEHSGDEDDEETEED